MATRLETDPSEHAYTVTLMSDAAADFERLNLQELVLRVERTAAETRRFVSESHRLDAEAKQLDQDRQLAGWQLALGGVVTGAALFAFAAGFLKLIQ